MNHLSPFRIALALGGACLLFCPPQGVAQTAAPTIYNAQLETRTVSGRLEVAVAEASAARSPLWVAYAVPSEARRQACCGEPGALCHLEQSRNQYSSRRGEERDRDSERAVVWARFDAGRLDDLRVYGESCPVDAEGLTVQWWDGVTPEASRSWLQSTIDASASEKLRERAVMVLAHHEGERVDESLEALAMTHPDHDTKEKAVFWMGAIRGQRSFEALSRLSDASLGDELHEKVVFAIHLSEVDGATPKLIELARRHPSSEVREKALFWLAQKAGKRAAPTIAQAALEDPELDVKKRAIFALSQLPADDGIPLLIEMARTHPHPKIRKQAMFWLGQSGDERAVQFFERVLLER